MVETQIEYHVVAHPKRLSNAFRLAESISGCLYIDTDAVGAAENHLRALQPLLPTTTHIVVLEDDAEPVKNFNNLTKEWIERFPDRLISFYLGTSRPVHIQPTVDRLIREIGDTDFIELSQLIHGVCYAIPVNAVEALIDAVKHSNAPADYRIGNGWRAVKGTPVIYTYPSYVDHEDGDSVETHPDGETRIEPRKARLLYNNDNLKHKEIE